MSISQNTALFSLLGTTYGGDGRVTFGLPNLQGSTPMQQGQGPGLSQRYLGEIGGESSITLLASEMPMHTHSVQAVDGLGNRNSPEAATFAKGHFGKGVDQLYSTAAPNLMMKPTTSGVAGGGLPHNNMPPYLTVTFIIALQGIFPQRP
jgi:microcystin-dependent protein